MTSDQGFYVVVGVLGLFVLVEVGRLAVCGLEWLLDRIVP